MNDVLEGIDEEIKEDSKFFSYLKKISLFLISLFLIFLVLSYLVPGNNILNIIEGRFDSNEINDDFVINLENNSKVVFNFEIYKELRKIYLEEQENEFKVCLIGNKVGKTFYVSDLERPKIHSQDVFSVSAQECSDKTIIPLHSHPFKHCLFSSQDIKSYELFKKINEDGIIGLMCEEKRFSFYGY